VWSLRDGERSWDRHIAELKRFRDAYGHADVPLSYAKNPALGRWLNKQRQKNREERLPLHRVRALTALGVEWNAVHALWEGQWKALVAFKKKHGHCNVPAQYWANRRLGQWLSRQRYSKKQGQLSRERIQRLTNLGVVWSLKRGPGRRGLF
jgi:hypothetical protein